MEPDFMAIIAEKCERNCGMRRAWEDGKCRAGVEVCVLFPFSPLADNTRPAEQPAYEDL